MKSLILRARALNAEYIGLIAMVLPVFFFPRRMPGSVVALGVLGGLILALHGIGLLLVYQSDRIINFSQIQIGALGATFFVVFARYMPVFELIRNACPTCIERVTPAMYRWNYVIAAVGGIALSLLVGWLAGAV
ncbi:MAG TPA: hypothetical protein VM600_04490, partial [Actinomycetota bacterium]|nr:hypothetical protein [Actinomycetota bacterium]